MNLRRPLQEKLAVIFEASAPLIQIRLKRIEGAEPQYLSFKSDRKWRRGRSHRSFHSNQTGNGERGGAKAPHNQIRPQMEEAAEPMLYCRHCVNTGIYKESLQLPIDHLLRVVCSSWSDAQDTISTRYCFRGSSKEVALCSVSVFIILI